MQSTNGANGSVLYTLASPYSKGDPCIIEMTTGKCFETSRRKKQEVLERLHPKQ